jgi:hypothetical protein
MMSRIGDALISVCTNASIEGKRTGHSTVRISAPSMPLVRTSPANRSRSPSANGERSRSTTPGVHVVRGTAGTVVGEIEDARLAAAKSRPPGDLAAYDLWLRGWSALRRADLAAIGEARQLFQQAVARDPHFARAYAGLAMAHLNEWACLSWNHWFFLRKEAMDLA